MKVAAMVVLSVLLSAGCQSTPRTATNARPDIISFDMLPPEMQEKGRAMYGPNVADDFQQIVDRAIQKQPWIACFCDRGKKTRECNPTSWACCGSAVFNPQDASSCAIPSPCNCPPPPTTK